MRFVEVTHPDLGVTRVPESRVKHMSEGWTLVGTDAPAPEPAEVADPGTEPTPRKRASRARETTEES